MKGSNPAAERRGRTAPPRGSATGCVADAAGLQAWGRAAGGRGQRCDGGPRSPPATTCGTMDSLRADSAAVHVSTVRRRRKYPAGLFLPGRTPRRAGAAETPGLARRRPLAPRATITPRSVAPGNSRVVHLSLCRCNRMSVYRRTAGATWPSRAMGVGVAQADARVPRGKRGCWVLRPGRYVSVFPRPGDRGETTACFAGRDAGVDRGRRPPAGGEAERRGTGATRGRGAKRRFPWAGENRRKEERAQQTGGREAARTKTPAAGRDARRQAAASAARRPARRRPAGRTAWSREAASRRRRQLSVRSEGRLGRALTWCERRQPRVRLLRR